MLIFEEHGLDSLIVELADNFTLLHSWMVFCVQSATTLEAVLYPDDTWATCDGGQDYLSVDIVYSALDRHNAFFYL